MIRHLPLTHSYLEYTEWLDYMAGVSTVVSVVLQGHHLNASDGCLLEVYDHYDIQNFLPYK